MMQCASGSVHLDMYLRQLKQILMEVATTYSRRFYNNVDKRL